MLFAFGMSGFIQFLIFALSILAALIDGVPYMLFLTQDSKFGIVAWCFILFGYLKSPGYSFFKSIVSPISS